MKKHLSTIILVLAFFIGVSLLLYPSVSDYINSLHQTQAIAQYEKDVAKLSDEEFNRLWDEAKEFNRMLAKKENQWIISDDEKEEYERVLNANGSGAMGYIEIPKINCYLPIYHGTDDGVLQTSIGHLEGSSLPIGGEDTHCILSGHRGLPSAKLFSELDKLNTGDTFFLHTLEQVLTYEVDQILIVLPSEVEALKIESGKDQCTLVTCTPYGINSHRMLVRGHRIENETEEPTVRVVADAIQIEPVVVAPIVAAPILLLLMIWVLIGSRKKK